VKNPICSASYEHAIELMAGGCPIYHPEALPHYSAAIRQSLRAELLPGYILSRVYEIGLLDTGYVIPLRLATDRSVTIISDWSFESPWKEPFIDWECEPEEIIPKKYYDGYRSPVHSRLMEALHRGCLIRRGRPVDRLLCGRSIQPMGASSYGVRSAELSLTDDLGYTVRLCIDLDLCRLSNSSANRRPVGAAGHRVFSDLIDSRRPSDLARQIEAQIEDE
jgi:hypothetical protein